MEISFNIDATDISINPKTSEGDIEELVEEIYDSLTFQEEKDKVFGYIVSDISDNKLIDEIESRGYYVYDRDMEEEDAEEE